MANKTSVSAAKRVRPKRHPTRADRATRTVAEFFPTPFWEKWSVLVSNGVLIVLTLACLLPFSGRAFHVDDTLFVWTAQHIVKHPFDPYGFQVQWDTNFRRMPEVTQNPPLACYYSATVGLVWGWSERALHLAYVLPAIAVVLGTFRLARRFCRLPVSACICVVLSPAVLLCATSVMCDTMMLAFWVWASALWLEGIEKKQGRFLALSAILIAAAALTKYFGASLIALLFVYSVLKERRVGSWAWYFAIPVAMLAGYEYWTSALYGKGLISSAADYATAVRRSQEIPVLQHIWTSLSFLGGSVLPALVLAPWLWRRRTIALGGLLTLMSGIFIGLLKLKADPNLQSHWLLVTAELSIFMMGGVSLVGLAAQDLRTRWDANSWFLALWIGGTFLFAGFLNWTTNVRSVLPLVPAAAIILARKLEFTQIGSAEKFSTRMLVAFCVMAVPALWITIADSALANAGKEAARSIRQKVPAGSSLWFEGHWGFQYYMEQLGAHPVDFEATNPSSIDYIAVPKNNYYAQEIAARNIADESVIEIKLPYATTIQLQMGAGCYSSLFGPLPFVFGPVPPERYVLIRVSGPR